MNYNKIIGLIGLAIKQKKIAFGKDMINNYIYSKNIKSKILIFTYDTDSSLKREFIKKCNNFSIPYILDEKFDNQLLSKLIKKNKIVALAVIDENIVKAILEDVKNGGD